MIKYYKWLFQVAEEESRKDEVSVLTRASPGVCPDHCARPTGHSGGGGEDQGAGGDAEETS